MKILVTGAKGFIGKNLVFHLKEQGFDVLTFDALDNEIVELPVLVNQSDFIVHLAGINRPNNVEQFDDNFESTKTIIELVKQAKKSIPIIYSSSTQAEKDNSYGRSKKKAEDLLFAFQAENGNKTFVYRLDNVFGKWSRPNYNSVVATFCHNIARDLSITIDNRANEVSFIYIDDVVASFIEVIKNQDGIDSQRLLAVKPLYRVSLGRLVDLLEQFKNMRKDLRVPSFKDGFEKKLYATYLSYLPSDDFAYKVTSHSDNRGSFTELIRTDERGQFSVNIIKPGITKGNHYHHSKNERFIVVRGTCETAFRKIDSDIITRYITSGEEITVLDIPTGYTHSIKNIGDDDAVVFMWANEPFDASNPDTYFLEVEKNE